MTYTVKYKKTDQYIWRTLKSVEADGLLIDTTLNVKNVVPYRWFLLSNKTRVEIPMENMVFKFNSDRFLKIKTEMDAQAGQVIPIVN